MENKDGRISYKKCAVQREVICEVGCDYTLPDYLGDIKRIVMTRESVSVGDAYFEGGQILGNGVITYSIIYVDSDGRLTSAEFTKDYECEVRCDVDSVSDTYLTSRIVASSFRATTPRKVVAKTTVASSIRAFCDETITIPDEFSSGELEYKDEPTFVLSTETTHLPEREYAEKVAFLEGAMADDVSIISKIARPEIKSVEVHDGIINVKGQIKVECAVMTAPLAPTVETIALNINEECPIKSKDPLSVYAIPNLSSFTVSPNPTDDGCDLLCDLIFDLTVVEEENILINMPIDAYAPSKKVELEYNTVGLKSAGAVVRECFKSERRVDRTELGLSDARDIIISDAVVRCDPVSIDGDSLKLSGEIRYCGAAVQISEGGEISYVSFKNSVPYEHIVNNTCQKLDNVASDFITSVTDVSCKIDKDQIVFESIINTCGTVTSTKSCKYICSVSMIPREPEDACRRIVVYYPDKDESLYEVAKRFDTTARSVANINSLGIDVAAAPTSKGGLSGVKRLIIY